MSKGLAWDRFPRIFFFFETPWPTSRLRGTHAWDRFPRSPIKPIGLEGPGCLDPHRGVTSQSSTEQRGVTGLEFSSDTGQPTSAVSRPGPGPGPYCFSILRNVFFRHGDDHNLCDFTWFWIVAIRIPMNVHWLLIMMIRIPMK